MTLSSSDKALPRPLRMGAVEILLAGVDVGRFVFGGGAVGVYGAVFVLGASADAAVCGAGAVGAVAGPDTGIPYNPGIVFAAYPFIPDTLGL